MLPQRLAGYRNTATAVNTAAKKLEKKTINMSDDALQNGPATLTGYVRYLAWNPCRCTYLGITRILRQA